MSSIDEGLLAGELKQNKIAQKEVGPDKSSFKQLKAFAQRKEATTKENLFFFGFFIWDKSFHKNSAIN